MDYSDQDFSRVGNYLRSEILFCAGISPYRKPGSLTEDDLNNCGLRLKYRFGLSRKEVTVPQKLYKTL